MWHVIFPSWKKKIGNCCAIISILHTVYDTSLILILDYGSSLTRICYDGYTRQTCLFLLQTYGNSIYWNSFAESDHDLSSWQLTIMTSYFIVVVNYFSQIWFLRQILSPHGRQLKLSTILKFENIDVIQIMKQVVLIITQNPYAHSVRISSEFIWSGSSNSTFITAIV